MKYEEQLHNVAQRLSDFQRATVDYLYQRMYGEGQGRMLVADEVGLGKTWVAKGLVAKAFNRWQRIGNGKMGNQHSFNVFYICSNQQLAAQNLKKLNFTNDKRCITSQINRISLLAYKPYNEDTSFRIYALTPDTSFNEASTLGIKEERLMLYAILEKVPCLKAHKKTLGELLEGTKKLKEGSWNPNAESESYRQRLRNEVVEAYIERIGKICVGKDTCPKCYEHYGLNRKMSLLDFITTVVAAQFPKNVDDKRKIYVETIGVLRHALTDVCLELMDADIFIMDEFQRYSQLLDTKKGSEQATIAQKVFAQKSAKVLMLSATPFKAFTCQADEKNNEQHYKELKRVLRFLYDGSGIDWRHFEDVRSKMFSMMLSLKDSTNRDAEINEIQKLKEYVEGVYCRVIVRTEKIMASNDPNAMIANEDDKPLVATRQEIEDFINLDAVFRCIYNRDNEKAPSPIGYAKSAPYAMSFLREYKVGRKAVGTDIKPTKRAFINLDEVNHYGFPRNGHWPNGKLNILMRGLRKEAMLLWCPPSVNYYKPGGAFVGQERFTKTLIFSAWRLVPKMIATLVSYEAEKFSIGRLAKNDRIKYFADKRVAAKGDKARRPYRRLVFANKLKSMTTLLIVYPSRWLERMADPLHYVNKGERAKDIINRLYPEFKHIIADICTEKGDKDDKENTHVSWAIPMVVDQEYGSAWLKGIEEKIVRRNTETILAKEYIGELRAILDKRNPNTLVFPRHLTDSELQRQAEVMASLAIGSPAVCAYRALKRYFGDDDNVVAAAFQIGLAFIDLFNKPESIAVIELQYPQKALDYWQKVVRYCIDGNIQAMLDEYVFMLLNDHNTPADLATTICNVLSMRTASLKIDDAASFCKSDEESDAKHLMRTHYAAAFGINVRNSSGCEVRATNIREAFNSPFRPFVLATTSIGQEGLDFHWYCRRIVHWNLPDNPIDFEQREGRVNRFRGKVIRQRVADKYVSVLQGEGKPWDSLFKMAEKDKALAKFPCDIVPDWHFETDGVCIERVVPLYQFSQDIQRYEDMLRTLGLYRLTFGQPRQEELARAIDNVLTPEDAERLLIDLCPLKHGKSKINKGMNKNEKTD